MATATASSNVALVIGATAADEAVDSSTVSIDGNRISISTEVKSEKEEKGGNGTRTIYKEIYYGSASREFTLAHDIDEKASTAKYEDGILRLTLPKRKEAASKTLRIQ